MDQRLKLKRKPEMVGYTRNIWYYIIYEKDLKHKIALHMSNWWFKSDSTLYTEFSRN